MPSIHLIEGPVGAGKSTYAAALSQKVSGPWLNLDDWMSTLFSPDRPAIGRIEWYLERKQRCIRQIWKTTQSIIDSNSDVVLELGLIQKVDRSYFYTLVHDAGYSLIIHVLDALASVRRERVMERNRVKGDTYSMDVPDDFFDLANRLWEPFDESELLNFQVHYISTDI